MLGKIRTILILVIGGFASSLLSVPVALILAPTKEVIAVLFFSLLLAPTAIYWAYSRHQLKDALRFLGLCALVATGWVLSKNFWRLISPDLWLIFDLLGFLSSLLLLWIYRKT